MTLFAYLGDVLQLGVSSIMAGPTASSEVLSNTLKEHKVVRGKPVPQEGGEELDKRSFSFFFDESFCDPQIEYAKLRAARSSRSVLPLVFGNGGYNGKKYWIKSIRIKHQKTTQSGRLVRLDATIQLIEVPSGAVSLGGIGPAGLSRAVTNPFTRRRR